MRGLLWVLALFALAVGLSLFGRFDEAYVHLVVPPYRAELSLKFAVVGMICVFFVLHLLLRLFTLTSALPQRFRAFFQRRKSEKGVDAFGEAFRLFAEGDFSASLKKASTAYETGRARGAPALLAARAARKLRDEAALKKWTFNASEADAKMRSASLMAEAEMQIDAHRPEEALLILDRLRKLSSPPRSALWLELRVQKELGNPDEILKIARLLEKHAVPSPESIDSSEPLSALKTAMHAENLRKRSDDASRCQAYWNAIPKDEITSALAEIHCRALLWLGASEGVQKIIETQIEREWHSGLAALYAELPNEDDLSQRLSNAEKWLPKHSGETRLLLALGQMALSLDTNKARIYLNAARARQDNREARLLLARLEETEGNTEEALKYYRLAAESVPRAAQSESPAEALPEKMPDAAA
ncbi:MAG: hypothetical protein LBJ76_02165 [Candidatus Accumulibacter sp.]|jgi:HemY protein|nr:hypothetical protein [Accumulibacter sp.]